MLIIMLFKMNKLKISFIVICFFISSAIPVSSNPLPLFALSVEEGSNPVPDNDTPLILVSEEVDFYISDHVYVTGRYTIHNPTNYTINQTVYFPFNKQYYYNFGEFIYGEECPYSISSLRFNNTNVPYVNSSYNDPPAIHFNVAVLPNSTDNITISYETYYGISFETKCELIYITTTGKAWNGSISRAKFNFLFDNNYIDDHPQGLDDYYIEENETIGHIEKFDWTPREDISITWNTSAGLFNRYYYDPYYSIELGPIIDEMGLPIKNVTISLKNPSENISMYLNNNSIANVVHTDEQGLVDFKVNEYDLYGKITIVAEKEGFNTLIIENITIYHNTLLLENETLIQIDVDPDKDDDENNSVSILIYDRYWGLPLYLIVGIITVIIIFIIVMIVLRKRK